MESRGAAFVQVVRPIAAAAFLSGLALWLTCDPSPARPRTLTASLAPHLEVTPPRDLFAPAVAPIFGWSVDLPGAVIKPPALRDAQEWPRGMVIHPPSTNDRIAVSLAGPLDSLLSALLAPWLAVAS